MLTLLLAASLLQDAPAPQESGGLIFTVPAGWTRREDPATKATLLLPPNADANTSMILYPASPDVVESPPVIHARMFQALTAAGKVEGERQTGALGRFQWTSVTITLPGQAPARLALYTAKSGTTAGVVFYMAPGAVFRKHLAEVERLIGELRFAGDPAPQAIHGLVLPLPAGWTRKDDPKGAVALHPPPPQGPLDPTWDYVMYVLPSMPLRGTHWETHRAVFDEVLKGSGLRDPVSPTHSTNEGGPFIRSASGGQDATGRVRLISMYSARSDDAIECLLIHSQEDRDGLRPILERTVLRKPRKVERPRVVEAYRRVNDPLRITATGVSGSLQYERIWLRSDGVADFTTNYPPGYAVSPEALKADPGLRNGSYGSWKAQGETHVEIVRTAGAKAEVYARENGRLRLGSQIWQPMPSVDGLRLEGRWGVADVGIAFTKDGRFQDDGLAHHAAVGDGLAKPPKRGAGTYEIREWTLFLRYDDGASWTSDFSTIGPDPKDHSSILLRTSAYPSTR